jgi:nicotinate-nucleotide adenylyltransferase
MEIALFGGSFDPPHIGHLLMAAYVLATEPVDELWMLPVAEHPFRKRLAGSFDHRVDLCRRALSSIGLPRASVSTIEAELGGEGRTVDLLEHLHARRPGDRFALVLGSDLVAERHAWKRFDRIEQLARVISIERKGHETSSAPPLLPEVSSTEVRRLLAEGLDASRLVPRDVLTAIAAAGSYRA